MAHTFRLVGGILLLVGAVLAMTTYLAPTGDVSRTVTIGDEVRTTTETFDLLGLHIDRAGATPDRDAGWYDAEYDGRGGITYLRGAPIAMTISLTLVATGGILALIPASRASLAPGLVSVTGVVGVGGTTLIHYLGLRLHIKDTFGEFAFPVLSFGGWLLLVGLVIAVTGVVFAFLYDSRTAQPAAPRISKPAPVKPIISGPARPLQCPRCQQVNHVPRGVVPKCVGCGFSG